MPARRKGRHSIIVNGREFIWFVDRDIDVRIMSADKKFIVAYRWYDHPVLQVVGSEFPNIMPTEQRPVMIVPPPLNYRSPAGLARQIIHWALYSGDHELKYAEK